MLVLPRSLIPDLTEKTTINETCANTDTKSMLIAAKTGNGDGINDSIASNVEDTDGSLQAEKSDETKEAKEAKEAKKAKEERCEANNAEMKKEFDAEQSVDSEILDVQIDDMKANDADITLESIMSTNTLRDLRVRCKDLNLPQTGNKVDLAKRIMNASARSEHENDDDDDDIVIQ
jgi:hypothetical protein